eukprot:scaffold39142_cov222-Skeletonema_dohrnii-CCMP3373.AAC.3
MTAAMSGRTMFMFSLDIHEVQSYQQLIMAHAHRRCNSYDDGHIMIRTEDEQGKDKSTIVGNMVAAVLKRKAKTPYTDDGDRLLSERDRMHLFVCPFESQTLQYDIAIIKQ